MSAIALALMLIRFFARAGYPPCLYRLPLPDFVSRLRIQADSNGFKAFPVGIKRNRVKASRGHLWRVIFRREWKETLFRSFRIYRSCVFLLNSSINFRIGDNCESDLLTFICWNSFRVRFARDLSVCSTYLGHSRSTYPVAQEIICFHFAFNCTDRPRHSENR